MPPVSRGTRPSRPGRRPGFGATSFATAGDVDRRSTPGPHSVRPRSPGAHNGPGGVRLTQAAGDVEDEPRARRAAVEDLLDGLVDVVEGDLGVEDLRQAAAVQREDLLEVVVRADDRPADR